MAPSELKPHIFPQYLERKINKEYALQHLNLASGYFLCIFLSKFLGKNVDYVFFTSAMLPNLNQKQT